MSHNITLKGVKIKDLDMLGHVVKGLVGGNAFLDKNAKTFRTYADQSNVCDAAIRLQQGAHDIGLTKQADGSYMPVFDPYNMSSMFKSQHVHGGSGDPAGHIGNLLQEYGLQAAEYEAAQNSLTTTRVHGEKGRVSLEITTSN